MLMTLVGVWTIVAAVPRDTLTTHLFKSVTYYLSSPLGKLIDDLFIIGA